MNRRHILAAAGLAVLFVAASSLEFAGIADAHDSNFTLRPECTGETWTVHYVSTATMTELDPQAVIKNSNDILGPTPGNWSHDFIVAASMPSFTAQVHFFWSDGFTKDVGPKTVERPACEFPPPATVPPPGEVTTSPTTTPSTTSLSTTVPPPSTAPVTSVAPGTGDSPTPSAASSTRLTQPTGQTPTNLPATGTSSTTLAVIGGALSILGFLLIFARRRGSES